MLSMLGILGFIPVAWLFMKNLYFVLSDKKCIVLYAVLGGVLIFFMVHMVAEGYIIASGSFLFFMLWATLGAAVAYRKTGAILKPRKARKYNISRSTSG